MIIKSTIPKIIWWLQQQHESWSWVLIRWWTLMAQLKCSCDGARWQETCFDYRQRVKVDKIRNYFCLHPSNVSLLCSGFLWALQKTGEFQHTQCKFHNLKLLNVDFSLKCAEYLCISVFVELTVEQIAFVYLISHLCWRKLKWKWHHCQRICNSSEPKTIRPAEHVILRLRGWARHPEAQTGLRSVFAWACVLGRLRWCATTRNPQWMKRTNGCFFCVDRRTLCILVLSQQGQIDIHTHLWGCVCVFACSTLCFWFCCRSVSPIVCPINITSGPQC